MLMKNINNIKLSKKDKLELVKEAKQLNLRGFNINFEKMTYIELLKAVADAHVDEFTSSYDKVKPRTN